MARSHKCFFGPDRSYHDARRRFVRKLGAAAGDLQVASPAQVRSAPRRRGRLKRQERGGTPVLLARGPVAWEGARMRIPHPGATSSPVPRSILPVSLALAVCALVPSTASAAPRDDARVQRGLERFVDAAGGPPGAIATFHRHGRTTVMTAGVAVAGTRRAPRATDHMRIASVAKAFSGAVVLGSSATAGCRSRTRWRATGRTCRRRGAP